MDEIVSIQGGENAVIDIIFVGDPVDPDLEDWRDSFNHTKWFKDVLAKKFVNARSLYYRYKTQSSRESPDECTNHAAYRLLSGVSAWVNLEAQSPARSLAEPSEDAKIQCNGLARPLIFVCQGFGGLVLEKALLLSELEEELHTLSRRAFGIIFLGSPHAGSMQKSIVGLLEMLDRSKRKHLRPIAGIDKPSARLTRQSRRPDGHYIRIYFCWETSTPCPGARVLHHHCLGSMVPQSWLSATTENHYIVPKTLPHDIARANIERSISLLSEEAAKSQEDHRRWLKSEASLLQTYPIERSASNSEWFFDHQKYRKWFNEAQSPLLWIKGRPGAGKSNLCSALVRTLQKKQEQGCAVVFCFFGSRQGQVSSARYILKAFAYQLRGYMRRTEAESVLRSTIREGYRLTEHMSLDDFQRKLRSMFVSIDIHARVFFIIDGLSNDEGVEKAIMHEILRVNRSREKSYIFRCAISSRSACEARISDEDFLQVDLTTEPGIHHDMLEFATARLDNILRASPNQAVSTLALARQLCSRANGVFLWLALALDDIQLTKSHQNPLQVINSLPASIDAFYQRALERIPPQDVETAQKIFSWLTVASRLLYLSELLEALAVRDDQPQLHEQSLLAGKTFSLPKTQAEIQRICGWLVTTNKEGIVSLRHQTLREYLLPAAEPSNHSRHPVLAAHELLARSCLVLLTSVTLMDESTTLTYTKPAQTLAKRTTSTLTSYAAANWSVHYRLSETYSRNLAGILQRCLNMTLDYDCQSFSIPNSGRSIQIANTTLRISASYGLLSLTKMCLQMGTDPKGGSCVLCKAPLAIAVGGGYLETANIILQGMAYSASSTSYNAHEMAHFAVLQGFTDVAKSLLECGTKVDAVELDSGKTLLHVAAESDKLDMVELLISHGADVNAVIPKTRETPLHLAVAHGFIRIVKYIVDGRNTSMRELELYDSIVRQPYYQSWTENLLAGERRGGSFVLGVKAKATAEEHFGELRACLARYSDINKRTSTGRTALEIAASNGRDDIVRFLLERGADVKSEGVSRRTALQAAVENGHFWTVKLLLEADGGMQQKADGLAATLEQACGKGHDAIADLVIWHFFNAELSANKLQWPVLCLPMKSTSTVVCDALRRRHLTPNSHGLVQKASSRKLA